MGNSINMFIIKIGYINMVNNTLRGKVGYQDVWDLEESKLPS